MLIAVIPFLLASMPGPSLGQDQNDPLAKSAATKVKPFDKPPKEMQIAPAGADNWKKSSLTLSQLAEKVGNATANLREVTGYLDISVQTPEGLGVYRNPTMLFKVMDNQRFRVDYVVIQKVPFTCTLSANGITRDVRLDDKIARKPMAWKMAAAKDTPQALVRHFELDFSRMIFQGLTEGTDAWKGLFHGWASNYDGYRPIVEERKVMYKKHLFVNFRVRVERDAATAKKLGPSAIEIVIDGNRFLPVTIRNVRRDLKGKLWFAFWSCGYRFDQKPKLSEMRLGG